MTLRYQLQERINTTGFGDVFRATARDASVAQVQLVHRQYASNVDLEVLREAVARTLEAADHPSIPRTFALVSIHRRTGVVSELVDGVPLSLAGFDQRLSLKATLQIVEKVASALAYVWDGVTFGGDDLNWFHGDVHPGNIYLDERGQVFVTEFGLHYALLGDSDVHGESTVEFGSLPYMSPERVIRQEGASADIYSLGVILYELIVGTRWNSGPTAGVRPDNHQQNIDSLVDTAGRVLGEPPEWLRDIMTRMLAFEPTERPSAREVAEVVGAHIDEAPGMPLEKWVIRNLPEMRKTLAYACLERDESLYGAPVTAIEVGPPTAIEPMFDTPPPTEERVGTGNVPGIDRPPGFDETKNQPSVTLLIGIAGFAVALSFFLLMALLLL